MNFGTLLLHNGNEVDGGTGALSIPVYQVATFHQADLSLQQEFDYSRSGNPTRKALENAAAILEGGQFGYAFSSGMAATSSVLSIFNAGDHILVCEDVYGGTYRAVTQMFNRFDLQSSFIDAGDLESIQSAIRKETKAIFLETPSNPLLKITDLKAVIAIARSHKLLVIVDNTFMSPYLQRPLDLGTDIVIHSATKFIGGHSDVVGGLVIVGDESLARRIYAVQNGYGAILGPQDSWLLLRGLKTLKLRLDCQQKNAEIMADWLLHHPVVSEVFYPGLPDHPGRAVHFSQAAGAGAVLSFKTVDDFKARQFMNNVKLAAVAVSLGGVETIVSYPVRMSHAAMPAEQRIKLGITENLIRVSVGAEDISDLLEDFAQALR